MRPTFKSSNPRRVSTLSIQVRTALPSPFLSALPPPAGPLTSPSLPLQRAARLVLAAATHKVEFVVPECPVEFGQCIAVVGSESLGQWNAAGGLTLTWAEGDSWSGSIELPEGAQLEFKLVKVAGNHSNWEDGANRSATVPAGGAKIVCSWGDAAATAVEAAAAAPAAKAEAPPAPKPKSKKVAAAPVVEVHAHVEATHSSSNGAAEHAAAPEPVHAAPAAAPSHHAHGITLPPEMAALASSMSQGADGTLNFTFGDAASGVDAAALAAKLQ